MEDNVNFDNEILAYLSVRKDELIDSHKTYIHNHPEIREVLNDFLSSLLLHKPNDVFVFAKEYFHPFNPTPLKYKPLIVVGPSGVGKGTLIDRVIKKYSDLFEKKVSYTTRPQKSYEKSQGNYHFISKEDFMRRVEKNEFIEWCNVHGHLYGTTYAELERIKSAGKIPIIEVDVQGAIRINEKALEGNFLFIYPPSFEELRRRLGSRLETEEDFKKRIQAAIKEIETANNSVLFTNRLENDDLESAVDQFFTLIEALYFQEIKNIQGESGETQSNINQEMADNKKSYFSALARGGLSAALNYQQQNYDINKSSKKGGYDSEDNINNKGSQQNYPNKKESAKKAQLPPQPQRENRIKQSIQYEKENIITESEKTRLRSLMDGNDLHTLQEEVSKEEDDSTFLVRIDGCQSSKSIKRPNMKNSLSSIDSCNYVTKMEEGYVQYEVSNNSSLKIFDSQFQNSSHEHSLQHRSNSLKEAKEFIQNQSKKQLAKQLLDGIKQETEVLQAQNQNVPVEQRLFEYQKKAQEKIEMKRIQKDEQEAQCLKFAPQICPKSTDIVRRRSHQESSLSPQEESSRQSSQNFNHHDYFQDLKKKEEARLKVQEQQEMQGFTGKPEINKKSKQINRKLDDLMDWKQTQQLKREHELQKKLYQENQEIEKLQNMKKVSKTSQKILESKFGQRQERVEDRLLRDGQVRQKKIQLELASQISNKKLRNRSKSTKNCAKAAITGSHQKMFSFAGPLNSQNSQKQFAPVLQERYNSQERCPLSNNQNMLTFQQSKTSDQMQLSYEANFSNNPAFSISDQMQNLVTPIKNLDGITEPSLSDQKRSENYRNQQNIFQDQSGITRSIQGDFSPFSQGLSSYQSDNGKQASFPFSTAQHQQFQLPEYSQPGGQPKQLQQQISVNQIQPPQNALFLKQNHQFGETPKSQPSSKKNSNMGMSQHSKKKTVQYESLFHKVQKMNSINTSNNYTNNTPDDKSSNSCSIQFASAKGTFNFPYYNNNQMGLNGGGSVVSTNSCEINPIYLSIHQEKMRMEGGVFNYQPQYYQPKNFEGSAGKETHTEFSNSIDIPQQIIYTDTSQVLSQHNQGRLTYPSSGVTTAMKNPQYQADFSQDALINKILENSYIPNGNVKDARKAQVLNQDIFKFQTLQPNQYEQALGSQRNQSNPFSDQKLHHFKSSEDTLYKPDGSKETLPSHRPASETRALTKSPSSPMKPQNFYDRNNVWLQKKNHKIEVAKNIKDKKEERQCTFKPQISNKSQSQGPKAKNNGSNNPKKPKSPNSKRWFKNLHSKETKEEGVQVDVYGKKSINDKSEFKSPQKKDSDLINRDQSAHTTQNLNQAIEMMNFEDADKYMKSSRKGLHTSMSEQCDISCLSPEKNAKVDEDCSNFDSASFMSVGMEQATLFQNKKRLAEPLKFMTKKNIQF